MIDTILFIIAPARTGTTLVKGCLGSHPDVVAPFELHIMRPFVDMYYSDGLSSWQHVREHLAENDVLLKHTRSYLIELYNLVAGRGMPKVVIDKSLDYNVPIVAQIRELLGDRARFLFLERDPRAVVASTLARAETLGERWYGPRMVLVKRRAWELRRAHEEMRNAQKTLEAPYFCVTYEDFVAHPGFYCKSIWRWLGLREFALPGYDAIREAPIKMEGLDEPSFWTNDEIRTDRVEAWRDYLSEEEAEAVTRICCGAKEETK